MGVIALIPAVYSTKTANKAILLGSSRLTISFDGQSLVCPGKAILRMQPRLKLVLSADLSGQPLTALQLMTAKGPIKIQYGSRSRPTNVFMLNSTWNYRPEGSAGTAEFVPNPERLTICDNRRTRLASITFHVMNFPAFLSQGETATDIRHETSPGQWQMLGRTILENSEWRIELQTLPNATPLIEQLKSVGGYAITHVGRLERKNGGVFWISQAENALEDLRLFLSFARGLWVPIVLPVGVDRAGNRVFEDWSGRLATRWEPCSSWFDISNGQLLGSLYSGFIDLLHDCDMGESVRVALYWYLRSNRAGEGAGVDSGVILSQSAIERLTVAYLAKVGLSTQGKTAERFRRAFHHLKIPIDIPKGMSAIITARRKGIWVDMPEVLVKVRNELTHPEARLNIDIGKVVADVWNIAQWYIELCILRLAGYRGEYSPRLSARWRGETKQVPWAK